VHFRAWQERRQLAYGQTKSSTASQVAPIDVSPDND
jgi:hypothetical protein